MYILFTRKFLLYIIKIFIRQNCVSLYENYQKQLSNNNNMSIKIACCISGYPSSKIIDHLLDLSKYSKVVDFFVFFWDVIPQSVKNRINMILQPKDVTYQTPVTFNYDAVFKEHDKQGSKQNALSMFYGISKVQEMRNRYEQKMKLKYDVVYRFRYDLYMFTDLFQLSNNLREQLTDDNVIFPFTNHHIGICDQLWCGKPKSMNKFIGLSDWIRDNIKSLFFVNESVLYKFIESQRIQVTCYDIKFVIKRDCNIKNSHDMMLKEYQNQLQYPWVEKCPEIEPRKYRSYISFKNNSANSTYFITNGTYHSVECKLFNIHFRKYLSISQNNELVCNDSPTIFTVYTKSSFIVGLSVRIQQRTYFVCIRNGKIGLSDENTPLGDFFIIKQGGGHAFLQYTHEIFESVLSMNSSLKPSVGLLLNDESYWTVC